MKFFLNFIFITAIVTCLEAQNLVQNPSFEIYSSCPTSFSQIQLATGWENWLLSPDYFNVCVPNGNPASVPNGFNWSYQVPNTGNAYAGLFTYWTRAGLFGNPYGRELMA